MVDTVSCRVKVAQESCWNRDSEPSNGLPGNCGASRPHRPKTQPPRSKAVLGQDISQRLPGRVKPGRRRSETKQQTLQLHRNWKQQGMAKETREGDDREALRHTPVCGMILLTVGFADRTHPSKHVIFLLFHR